MLTQYNNYEPLLTSYCVCLQSQHKTTHTKDSLKSVVDMQGYLTISTATLDCSGKRIQVCCQAAEPTQPERNSREGGGPRNTGDIPLSGVHF